MRKKVIAAAVVVALVGGGGYYVYQQRSQAAAAAQSGVRVIPAVVQRGDIRTTISGTGPVASVNGVLVKANQTGTVAQLLAQDGDRVKAGQVIMRLTNDSLEASLKQAEIDLQNNRDSINNLLNPQDTAIRTQQLKVESARLTLKQRQTDVDNLTVSAPLAGIVTAVNAVAGSSIANNAVLFTIYDEQSPTFIMNVSQQAAGALTPGTPVQVNIPGFHTIQGTVQQSAGTATPASGNKDATVAVPVSLPHIIGLRPGMVGQASARVDGLTYMIQASGAVENDAVEVRALVTGTANQVAVKEGDRVQAGDLLLKMVNESLEIQLQQAENDLAVQEQSLQNLLNPASDPSGNLHSLRTKLEQSQLTHSNRLREVQELEVKAPVDGQISSLTLRVGDKITNNQNLFRVADYGAMQITITVDELDIAKVKAGQSATVTLDALPGRTYTGKVLKINPEGVFKNDIATFEVTVLVDKPEGLMAGMNSTVNVVVEDKKGVLWLPAQAVQVRQGKAYVQVMQGAEPVQKEIQIGTRTSQQVEVTGGLNEGDSVVLTIIRPTQQQGLGFFGGGNRQQQNQPTVQPAPGAGTPGGGVRVRPGGAQGGR